LRTFIASNEIVSDPFFHIGFFHLGADLENSIPSRGIPVGGQELLDRLASQKTFLMVGTIEPRKGHEQVLAAFENCWNIGIDATLVIVGKQGWKMEAFIDHLNKHVENGRGLLYLKQISDEFLNELYNTCSCLVAASECEGFGLPLIEAAKHKLPIIARDIPVFREVAGEHAYYFSADEPEQLAQAIQSWLDLYKNKAHPKSDSMPWLTWKQSSQQLLAAIELTVKDSQTQIGIN
jgi:glycosyltransferase involved in cell wall biosynthesis